MKKKFEYFDKNTLFFMIVFVVIFNILNLMNFCLFVFPNGIEFSVSFFLISTIAGVFTGYLFGKSLVLQNSFEKLSKFDVMTGCLNRHSFEDFVKFQLGVCKRNSTTSSYILLDIDNFKKLNDNYGHGFGDKVLVGVAKEIKDKVRKSDVVGRVGGEEFAIFLPNTKLSGAKILAEKVRTSISKLKFEHRGKKVGVTASFGISYCKSPTCSLDKLYQVADKYLYVSKKSGKNKVSFSP